MVSRGRGRPRVTESRDLRAQLLRVGRELLDEGGPTLLSLREVARRSGCTHQAPYHYFPNRESLLAALVAEGFDQLARQLQVARSGEGGPAVLLERCANAYVEFALRNPGVFRLMFRADVCDPQRHPEAQAAGDRARQELRHVADLDAGGEVELLESLRWSHVHGLATLLLDGPLGLEHATLAERLAHAARVNHALMAGRE